MINQPLCICVSDGFFPRGHQWIFPGESKDFTRIHIMAEINLKYKFRVEVGANEIQTCT